MDARQHVAAGFAHRLGVDDEDQFAVNDLLVEVQADLLRQEALALASLVRRGPRQPAQVRRDEVADPVPFQDSGLRPGDEGSRLDRVGLGQGMNVVEKQLAEAAERPEDSNDLLPEQAEMVELGRYPTDARVGADGVRRQSIAAGVLRREEPDGPAGARVRQVRMADVGRAFERVAAGEARAGVGEPVDPQVRARREQQQLVDVGAPAPPRGVCQRAASCPAGAVPRR